MEAEPAKPRTIRTESASLSNQNKEGFRAVHTARRQRSPRHATVHFHKGTLPCLVKSSSLQPLFGAVPYLNRSCWEDLYFSRLFKFSYEIIVSL